MIILVLTVTWPDSNLWWSITTLSKSLSLVKKGSVVQKIIILSGQTLICTPPPPLPHTHIEWNKLSETWQCTVIVTKNQKMMNCCHMVMILSLNTETRYAEKSWLNYSPFQHGNIFVTRTTVHSITLKQTIEITLTTSNPKLHQSLHCRLTNTQCLNLELCLVCQTHNDQNMTAFNLELWSVWVNATGQPHWFTKLP